MVYQEHICPKCESTVITEYEDLVCGECPKCGNRYETCMEYYEDGSESCLSLWQSQGKHVWEQWFFNSPWLEGKENSRNK